MKAGDVQLQPFAAAHEPDVRATLTEHGWTKAQVEGQLDAARALAASDDGYAVVAVQDGELAGFVSASFYAWNALVQIHGLAVAPQSTRRGIGSRLVAAAEEFARERGARGVYVDTPVNNDDARTFYGTNGYQEAYVMPRYYSDDLDGVTYVKFFEPAGAASAGTTNNTG